MTALGGFFRHVAEELTPTCTGNERSVAAPEERNADMALLHALTGADSKPQLEAKTYVLPVFWTNSSASPPQLTVRSVVRLAYANSRIAVAKSGQIVQVDCVSRMVSFNNGKKIVRIGEGYHFNIVAVDSNGLIWLSCYNDNGIWCINEEGQLLGVKKFSKNIYIVFVAFLGDQLVVVEHDYFRRREYRLCIYTSQLVEENPAKVIYIGQEDVTDLKICDRTGVVFLVQGSRVRAITPDGNVQDVNFCAKIQCLEITVNGELLACDSGGRVLRYVPVIHDNLPNFTYNCILSTFEHTKLDKDICRIVNLPNRQVALVEKYEGRMIVLDI